MFKLFKLIVIVSLFLIFRIDANACDIRLPAKSYVNRIHAVVGGEKPKLIIEKGISSERFGFYKAGAIHIYKGDYNGRCGEATSFLKSVIAHEYAHHIEKKFKKSFKLKFKKNIKLKGERWAHVAEHAIADEILGDATYDDDLKDRDMPVYDKITEMLRIKKFKK